MHPGPRRREARRGDRATITQQDCAGNRRAARRGCALAGRVACRLYRPASAWNTARVRRPAHRSITLVACFLGFGAVGLVLATRQRVDSAIERGDLTRAEAIQDRLAALHLDAPRQRFAIGQALIDAGRLDEAAAQIEIGLARSPQAEQWAVLAALHVRRDEPEAAIAAWERGFETNHDPRYLHRASKLLLARGEPERAFAEFERALSIEPPSSMIQARIADMARLMGLPGQQIRHLRAAIEFEPTRQSLRLQLAWLLATCEDRELRNTEEAVRLAEALVLETGRADASALDVLAAALAAGDRFDAAVLVAAEADDLASRRDENDLAASIRQRLALYRSGRAYVEPPRSSVSG
jgi:tetratricopeptide (TPR) repeat protein